MERAEIRQSEPGYVLRIYTVGGAPEAHTVTHSSRSTVKKKITSSKSVTTP